MGTTDRVLDIFELFAKRGRPLTLSQVAEELEAPVSSIFGLVKTLSERGYLHTVTGRKELYPTRRMLQNAETVARHEPVIARFYHLLEELRDQTGETVILGQMNARSTGVIYLSVVEGPQTIRYSAHVGDIKPLHASAIGKCLIGTMKDDKLEAFVRKLKLPKVTENTLVDAQALVDDVHAGRARGYQKTLGENVADVGAIAKPVEAFGQSFAIAVAGPVARIQRDEGAIVRALEACVEQIAGLG